MDNLNVDTALEEIGDAVMAALAYKILPAKRLEEILNIIDRIITEPAHLSECERHFKASGSNYVLFFLSNIIYNLKKPGELALTPDVLKWLGSVWKNFLKRNKSYQEMFSLLDEYRIKFRKYYPGGGTFVNQIDNVNQVREDFIPEDKEPDLDNSPLRNLERFCQVTSEIIGWMKPTYFFLLDFYYERKLNTGEMSSDAVILERNGLAKFGQQSYSYLDIILANCQSLGILEAVYLILKKRKASRRLVTFDGKQKFLLPADIYNVYLEKFNSMKKELKNLYSK